MTMIRIPTIKTLTNVPFKFISGLCFGLLTYSHSLNVIRLRLA